MILGHYQRFESIYHLVIAAQFDTLQAALRAVELSLGDLTTVLHRIEWDGETRIFRIVEGRLLLTKEGSDRVRAWADAIRALGIAV
jgi:hypothetical protein